MRGFAILFAILGFCSQYVNAVVVRGLSPVPKVEASADSSRVERAETLIFNKNNDAHATQTEVETGLSIDTGLILRQPPPPPPPNTPNQEHFPWDGNMLYYVQCIYDEQPLPRGRPRSPINVMRALVRRFVDMVDSSTFDSIDGLTLRDWILESWHRSSTSMANPITASQPLRQYATTNSYAGSMHSDLSFEDGNTALNEWYRLFLVPGAAHWSPSPTQPNGLFPQTNPEVLIDPVENGVATAALNASRR
ncbi:hypothetical protein V493_01584 [Pseudogymnoascus sp. VKM F-4281 (FW-2241)]|nr:hypothetical protein V493_01584 [Pseudogymnoascus sp. VKM F-4281 (FW-2241)]